MANDSPYTKPENVRAIVQVRTENGMPYNSFPDADDPTIQRWINNRTGEAHLILARNGAAVPIDPAISEAHAALFAFLATLVEYGAAAGLGGLAGKIRTRASLPRITTRRSITGC
jgi:hypothetical protein